MISPRMAAWFISRCKLYEPLSFAGYYTPQAHPKPPTAFALRASAASPVRLVYVLNLNPGAGLDRLHA